MLVKGCHPLGNLFLTNAPTKALIFASLDWILQRDGSDSGQIAGPKTLQERILGKWGISFLFQTIQDGLIVMRMSSVAMLI